MSVVDDFDSFSGNLFQIISEINDTSSFDYEDWFNKRVKSILGTFWMILHDNPQSSAPLSTTQSLTFTFKSELSIFSYSQLDLLLLESLSLAIARTEEEALLFHSSSLSLSLTCLFPYFFVIVKGVNNQNYLMTMLFLKKW